MNRELPNGDVAVCCNDCGQEVYSWKSDSMLIPSESYLYCDDCYKKKRKKEDCFYYDNAEKVYSSEQGNRIWSKDLNPHSHKWEGLLVRVRERK